MRLGSLFSGIGGFDLAALTVGWETVWFSEINPYRSKVLANRWPNVPNLGDIRHIKNPPKVDIICGGFPCQDVSGIGQEDGGVRHGKSSGLWHEFARIISECKPKWIVIENPALLRKDGLEYILTDLCALGYDAEWHCIPASYVGAPHQRDRIWIIAYPEGVYSEMVVGNAIETGLERYTRNGGGEQWQDTTRPVTETGILSGANAFRCWDREPRLDRVAPRLPDTVDRIKALGDSIVPQIAMLLFQEIEASKLLFTR